jgi:hypothetical protein
VVLVSHLTPHNYGGEKKAEESTDEKTDYKSNQWFLLISAAIT